MSLVAALNTGKSALAVHQAAIAVTGNNIANVGNADYTRQATVLAPMRDQQIRPGMFIGTGVNLEAISRQIDEALEGRIRGSISDAEGAQVAQQWLGRIEALFNELGDDDLSTRMSAFFNSWSNLANKPQDVGLRQVVVQNGQTLASWMRDLRGDLADLQGDIDVQLRSLATNADSLASQVADLNRQIVLAEGGSGGQANALRDARDAALKRLSELVDIKTVTTDNVINVYVGSEPLVFNTENRGIALKQTAVDGVLQSALVFKADGGTMKLSSGRLAAMQQVRSGDLQGAIDKLDALAGNLILELNKLHTSGQGLKGRSSFESASPVDDPAAVLNSEEAGLAFAPSAGSFVLHLKNKTTGLTDSTLVNIDPNQSLADLAADLDAIDGVSASISGGKLTIRSDSETSEISFSQDSTGILACLGIGGFFTGSTARDIEIDQELVEDPTLLAAAKNGAAGDNQTALAIAALESVALNGLKGASLKDYYQSMINGVGVAADSAKTTAEASLAVQDTLLAQREALSGVSLDEEAINLMRQQRAFQGAARLITVVDEMMKTVLNLV